MAHPDENADLRALVDESPEGVVVVREGAVIYVNRSFARLCGRTQEALRHASFLNLLAGPYRAPMGAWLRAAPDEDPENAEYIFVRPDQSRVMLQLTPMWLSSFAGQPARAFIARDVSLAKKTQADLLLADRMMTVGALASGVAHEINNPMSFVIGNLHYSISVLTQRDAPSERDRTEVVSAMKEALDGAERIARIVKNIHSFAKADVTSTTLLSLSAVVQSALTAAFVQIRRKARLVRDLRTTPPVLGNEPRLRQVVLNLILNAVEALPENQSTRHVIDVSTGEEAGQAVLRVADTGPGIAPQVLTHVFEPFFTTKPVGLGTGLGLSIAHSIIEQHGGTIEVDSALGVGTTFTVRLPRGIEAPDAEETSDSSRILVIDDEPLIVRAFTQVLRGYNLVVAHSGPEAIRILSDDASFTLIFCDLYMPEVSGMEVYEWVRHNVPGLERHIVFMSGGARDAVSQSFLARLPNPQLQKPFRPDDIHRMIRDAEH